MNLFQRMKRKIILENKHFTELSFFTRMKLKLFHYPSVCQEIVEYGTEKISVTYQMYFHQGKHYFYKFGR